MLPGPCRDLAASVVGHRADCPRPRVLLQPVPAPARPLPVSPLALGALARVAPDRRRLAPGAGRRGPCATAARGRSRAPAVRAPGAAASRAAPRPGAPPPPP